MTMLQTVFHVLATSLSVLYNYLDSPNKNIFRVLSSYSFRYFKTVFSMHESLTLFYFPYVKLLI